VETIRALETDADAVRGLIGADERRALMLVAVPRGLTGVGEVRPRIVRGLKGAEIWAGESFDELLACARVLDWAR